MFYAIKLFCAACLLLCCCLSTSAVGQPRNRTLEDDIRKLYGGNDDSRREAAQRLREAGADSIPFLVPVLCDKSKLHFDRAWPAAAKVLGDLKAVAAAPCLVQMLGHNYPPIGSPVSKTDETLRDADPAFAALVQIGAPAIPAIGSHLPLLHPEHSLMAIRILRIINTPAAKEAADAYIKLLEDQIRLAKQVVGEFGKDRGSYLK